MLQPQEAPEPLARPHVRLVSAEARGVRVPDLALAAIFCVFTVLLRLKNVDPDFWWHLKTGELITRAGIPRHDPFSWSMAGQPWVAHEWLAEALIYVVQSSLGYAGNLLLFGAIASAAMLVMYRLGIRLGAGRGVLVFLLIFAAVDLSRFAAVRPQLFTWLLFAVVVAILVEDDAHLSRRAWALPGIFALWANLHLGFYFGLMAVGCWAAAGAFDAVTGRESGFRRRALIALACAAGASLNPHGPDLLLYPFRYIDAPATHAYIAEWHRPRLDNPVHLPIFVSVALLALALALPTRPRPFLILLGAAVIVLALTSVRNAPFVELLAPPVAGAALCARWPRLRRFADSGRLVRYRTVALVLGLLVLALLPLAITAHGVRSLWSPSSDGYPAAAAAYVAEHDSGKPLLNEYGSAGFLIEHLYPETKVFIDGRTDFYGDKFLGDYMNLIAAGDGWQDGMREYQPDVVMLPSDTALIEKLRADPAWRVGFEDAHWVVLERR